MSRLVEATTDDHRGRKRRQRLFAVLAYGWFALMVALVLNPCCDVFATVSTAHHPVAPDARGEHAPAPCDPWLMQHLDLVGPIVASLVEGLGVTALVQTVSVPPLLATDRSLTLPLSIHGPEPPRPIFLTLLRLLL